MPDDAEFERLMAHLKAGESVKPWLDIDLSWVTALALIGHLQLSLRHPGNTGESASLIRGLTEGLIDYMDRYAPGIALILRKGWGPQYDVIRGVKP